MNTISLCITAFDQDYNLIPYLLEQFKEQTVAPTEIILYISGINSLDLPNKLSIKNTDIPINTIFSSKRTIQSIARNVCSSIASQDIVIFFDVDDLPHPQKIEATKHIFNKYNPDFLVHSYIQSYNRELTNFTNININNINIKTNLALNNKNTNLMCEDLPIHHAHIAVKKTVFSNVRFNESPKFYRTEDGKFCQDLLLNNYNGAYYTEPLVQYTL
jgi:glycosyltransferase involved in cell wall biosynthesis